MSSKKVNILSDYGLVFEDIDQKEFLQTHDVRYIFDPVPGSSIITLEIKLATQVDFYYRNFMKIQDAIALIGGMYSSISQLGLLFSFLYSESKFKELMINQLFDFVSADNSNNLPINTNGQPMNSTTTTTKVNNYVQSEPKSKFANHLNESNNINKSALEELAISANDMKESVTIKKRKKRFTPITINIFETFQLFLCTYNKKNKKLNFLDKVDRRINEKFDIMNMMLMFDEIEKLKFLVMDENQLILFNRFPKRVINNFVFPFLKSKPVQGEMKSKALNLQKHYYFYDKKSYQTCDDISLEKSYNVVCERVRNKEANQYDLLLAEIISEEFSFNN